MGSYGAESGGPSFSKDGNVIVITVLEQLDADDVNFFIPIDDALKFLNIKLTPASS